MILIFFLFFWLFWAILSTKPILPLLTPFCQMCDFREKLYNDNRHHFRPFWTKSMDSIFFKSPKTSFLGIKPHLTSFWEFSRICGFREKLYNNNKHRFRSFSAKSNDSIFFKSPKTSFLGHFGPKTSFNLILRLFSKNRALLNFCPYSALTSCKESKKCNEPFLRTTAN